MTNKNRSILAKHPENTHSAEILRQLSLGVEISVEKLSSLSNKMIYVLVGNFNDLIERTLVPNEIFKFAKDGEDTILNFLKFSVDDLKSLHPVALHALINNFCKLNKELTSAQILKFAQDSSTTINNFIRFCREDLSSLDSEAVTAVKNHFCELNAVLTSTQIFTFAKEGEGTIKNFLEFSEKYSKLLDSVTFIAVKIHFCKLNAQLTPDKIFQLAKLGWAEVMDFLHNNEKLSPYFQEDLIFQILRNRKSTLGVIFEYGVPLIKNHGIKAEEIARIAMYDVEILKKGNLDEIRKYVEAEPKKIALCKRLYVSLERLELLGKDTIDEIENNFDELRRKLLAPTEIVNLAEGGVESIKSFLELSLEDLTLLKPKALNTLKYLFPRLNYLSSAQVFQIASRLDGASLLENVSKYGNSLICNHGFSSQQLVRIVCSYNGALKIKEILSHILELKDFTPEDITQRFESLKLSQNKLKKYLQKMIRSNKERNEFEERLFNQLFEEYFDSANRMDKLEYSEQDTSKVQKEEADLFEEEADLFEIDFALFDPESQIKDSLPGSRSSSVNSRKRAATPSFFTTNSKQARTDDDSVFSKKDSDKNNENKNKSRK